MPSSLKWALRITDWAFLAYWTCALLDLTGLIAIPTDWLYAQAHEPRVVAWNWSFFPLDIAFAITGLLAVRQAQKGQSGWRVYALISLVLTMVAGGMAVAYWTLLQEFNWAWFLPNLALLVWPLLFLPRLVRELEAAS